MRIYFGLILLSLGLYSCYNRESDSSEVQNTPNKSFDLQEYRPVDCKQDFVLNLSQEEEDRSKNLYKVLIVDQSLYVRAVPSFMIDFTRGLEANGWHIFDSAKIQKSMLEDLSSVTGIHRYPDIVAIYNAKESLFEKWPEFYSKEMKKSILIHWPDEVWTDWIISGMKKSLSITDAIFPRYPHGALRVLEPDHPRCFHMPHAATHNFFKEIRTDKTDTVLLSGAIEPRDLYPLRFEAHRLRVLGNSSIVQRSHPGYQFMQDPESEARAYAEEISKHLIAISGGGLPPKAPAPSVFAKHFEIPAAGTALLTDEEMIPYLQELGFISGYHYIATRRDNLSETLAHWLDPRNRAELMAITKRGQDLVREFHRNEQRIDTFNRIAVNLFQEKSRRQ